MTLVQGEEERIVPGAKCCIDSPDRFVDDGAVPEYGIDQAEGIEAPVVVQATDDRLGLEAPRHVGSVQRQIPARRQVAIGNLLCRKCQCERDLVCVDAVTRPFEQLRTPIQKLGPFSPSCLHPRRKSPRHIEEATVEVRGNRIAGAPVTRYDAGNIHPGLRKDTLQHMQRRIVAIDNLSPNTVSLVGRRRW